MHRPLIGVSSTRRLITSSKQPAFFVHEAYIRAISSAGGVPILIPMQLSSDEVDEPLPHLDGVLFIGGFDVDPKLFGESIHSETEGIDPDRDRVEIQLVQALVGSQKPFLGICRGIQVINLALGGDLYQHIEAQLPGALQHDCHSGHQRSYLAHPVKVKGGTLLFQILENDTAQVNSLHHQGIRNLAPGLVATAHAPDGLIEAAELPHHPFGLAVQWHPEELVMHENMRRLFQAFIQAC